MHISEAGGQPTDTHKSDEELPPPIQKPFRTLLLWIAWLVDLGACGFVHLSVGSSCDDNCTNPHPLSGLDTAAKIMLMLGGLLVVFALTQLCRGSRTAARIAFVTSIYAFTTAIALRI